MFETPNSDAPLFLPEILEDLQDEVYVYDTDTLTILYANKAACLRCDWTPECWSKLNITDSSTQFDTDLFRGYVQPLLDDKAAVVRIEARHEKGPVEVTTRLSRSPGGQQVFVSVLRDCSERYRLDRARMESFSELSHEMRTPLTSIIGSLRLLETGMVGDLTDEARDLLQIAAQNTDRLLSMVNGILDLQRIAAGKLETDRAVLDLVALAHKSVSENQGYGWKHDVALTVADTPQTAQIEANGEQIMQVIANLLSNAIKHSPAQEVVTLGVVDQGDSWRVTVRDRGAGIPVADRETIFRSFARAAPSDGRVRAGTGLGLAISKKIVKLHGGQIAFTPRDGGGTEFHFDLPKANGSAR